MGQKIKIIFISIFITFMSVNSVRAATDAIKGNNEFGDTEVTSGGCGCLPAGGHAGYNANVIGARITLVDKEGNSKETVDFLFADSNGTIYYDKKYSSGSNPSNIVKNYLNSLINSNGTRIPRLVVLASYKGDNLDYGIGNAGIQKLNISDQPIVVTNQDNAGDVAFDYGISSMKSNNFVFTQLLKQMVNDNGQTVQLIISQMETFYSNKNSNKELGVSKEDYFVIEPLFLWFRQSLLFNNDIRYYASSDAGCGYYQYCIAGDKVYAYGTASNIFSGEKYYASDLLTFPIQMLTGQPDGSSEVRLCSYAIGDSTKVGYYDFTVYPNGFSHGENGDRLQSVLESGAYCDTGYVSASNCLKSNYNFSERVNASKIWNNGVWMYNTLYSLYIDNDELKEIIANDPEAVSTKNGNSYLFGKFLTPYTQPLATLESYYNGSGLRSETAYGLGIVSLKQSIRFCELRSDSNSKNWQAITESNYHLDDKKENLMSDFGDRYCCDIYKYDVVEKDDTIDSNTKVVKGINKSGDEFTLTKSEFEETSFYKKYCLTSPPKYKCKYVNNKYYDINGKVVSKDVYNSSCGNISEDYRCKYLNGKYYDLKGNIVSKEEYAKSCDDDTKGLLSNIIYRTISLENPFLYKDGTVRPLSKLSNWYDETKDPVTIGNYKTNVINSSIKAYDSNSPKYTINLNVSNIKTIRSFNSDETYSKESNCTFLCEHGDSIGININTVKSIGCSC